MYLLVYFGSKVTASQIRALGKTRQMICKKNILLCDIIWFKCELFCVQKTDGIIQNQKL